MTSAEIVRRASPINPGLTCEDDMKPTGKTHKKTQTARPTVQGCIYLLTNLTNGGRYVGQHVNVLTVERRWNNHVKDAFSKGGTSIYPLHRAIRKMWKRDGCLKSFTAEVIWTGSVELLHEKEVRYIKKFHTYIRDPLCVVGYNLTLGGEGCRGYKHTKAVKKQHSALMTTLWSTLKTRAVYIAAFNTPEYKVALSMGQLQRYKLMTTQEKAAISKTMSRAQKLRFKDETEREKARIGAVRRFENKTEREKLSTAAIQRFVRATPKQRAVWTKAIKDGHQTPQARAKSSKGMVAFWAKMTPDERSAYWRKTHPNGNTHKK